MEQETEATARIDDLTAADWLQVALIYQQGMATGNATFEKQIPSWEEWDRGHRKDCRIVLRRGQDLLGWAALSPVSGRCVYSGVAEVSVYVADRHQGRGFGSLLLAELVRRSEAAGLWTLEAGIFPENVASLHIHEQAGFRTVGIRSRLGRMDGRWRDVVLLERRSNTVDAD